jgi:hypothetical protein
MKVQALLCCPKQWHDSKTFPALTFGTKATMVCSGSCNKKTKQENEPTKYVSVPSLASSLHNALSLAAIGVSAVVAGAFQGRPLVFFAKPTIGVTRVSPFRLERADAIVLQFDDVADAKEESYGQRQKNERHN